MTAEPGPVAHGALAPSSFVATACILRLMAVDRAASNAPHPPMDVDGWAVDAFALLTGLPAVGRVGVALVEGGGRRLRFTASDRRSGSDLGWCHVDAYDDVPLNSAVRSGQPVIGALDDLEGRYADFVAHQRSTPYVAVAAVPLVAAKDVLGGYVLFFAQPQSFDDQQRAQLARLGHQLGDALTVARTSGERRLAVAESNVPTPPGALVAMREVPADLAAVGDARRFVRRTLAGWQVVPEVAYTAALCLSELVTNAVVHSHGGCVVRVMLHEGVVTAWVRDSGITGAAPLESPGDPLQVHGRGLQLVEALADEWGHDTDADGASVWFALKVS
jgi:anti-sigma regulatory factor (Ser/Thr protein kinase)